MITILGLGPGDPNLLTREAWEVLSQAKTIYLRTRKHPTVAGLPQHLTLKDFDAIYDANDSFEKVYTRIVNALIKEAKKRDVIYAVPGHPLVGEATVPMLLAHAKALNIKTRIVSGLSFIEPVLEQMTNANCERRIKVTRHSSLVTRPYQRPPTLRCPGPGQPAPPTAKPRQARSHRPGLLARHRQRCETDADESVSAAARGDCGVRHSGQETTSKSYHILSRLLVPCSTN